MAIKFLTKSSEMKSKWNDSLKYRLHKRMGRWEEARPHEVVHASDITKDDFCPRAFALCDITKKAPPGKFIPTSLRATFDQGKALQFLLNNEWGLDWCVGTWECVFCGKSHEFQHRPEKCDTCGFTKFIYREELFLNKEFGYSGSVDYIFDRGQDSKLVITEVKTIVKDDFKKLQAPLAEHRARTCLYLHSILSDNEDYRAPRIELEFAKVLYISKGYGCSDDSISMMGLKDAPFSPFKEFTINYDPSILAPYLGRAREIQVFREGGAVPKGCCANSFSPQAKKCPVRAECWGGDYGGVK